MGDIEERHTESVIMLGNLGARSWLSYQIWNRTADLAAFFGMIGFTDIERKVNKLGGKLLAWSIRLDRNHSKEPKT